MKQEEINKQVKNEEQEAERKPSANTHYGKPMSKERLMEIMKVIFPWGYAEKPNHRFVGPSPYLYDHENIITLDIDERYCDGAAFELILVKLDEECDESHLLGFYIGIMRVLAPEVECNDEKFDESQNVIDFYWKDDSSHS